MLGEAQTNGGEQGMPRTLRARKQPMISVNPGYAIWTHSQQVWYSNGENLIIVFVNRFYIA